MRWEAEESKSPEGALRSGQGGGSLPGPQLILNSHALARLPAPQPQVPYRQQGCPKRQGPGSLSPLRNRLGSSLSANIPLKPGNKPASIANPS
jgi:hypothetical protein